MEIIQLRVLNFLVFFWPMMAMSSAVVPKTSSSSSSEALPIAKPGCQSHCGDIEIPYPFGIGESCYDSKGTNGAFEITCGNSTVNPKPFTAFHNLEVLEISVEGTLRVLFPITYSGCNNKTDGSPVPNLEIVGFVYSQKNRFISVSCGRVTTMVYHGLLMGGCMSLCGNVSDAAKNNACGGINCCQTTVPRNLFHYNTKFGDKLSIMNSAAECNYAFLVDQDWFASSSTNVSAIGEMDSVPVLIEWDPTSNNWTDYTSGSTDCSSGRKCFCKKGFRGNPYLRDGCKDIDECADQGELDICSSNLMCYNYPGSFMCMSPDIVPLKPNKIAIIVIGSVLGLSLILIAAWGSHKVIKKRKHIKRKEKFFKQNGGLLLQKQSSGDVSVETIKLFNSEELEKATDSFSVDRILGQGGHGTVYKGMLKDGRIVAIKKSKIVDEGEVEQFINEIVILSQVIHRNVVKLLGCCLETEVPLLVYEFILNGTLSQYIYHQNEEFPLTWEMRLRVSMEVAGALSYLHSATSFPIYHRDIKSSNILLDDKYRAKVADFGTSRSVAIDKTHLTMSQVQGTFGYLDPEYFQSSQFTDKSDVYSFGVVLAELLTGQKPVSQTGPQEWRSLTNYFLLSMEENRLSEILDARIMNEGRKEEVMAVANLAKRCLNIKGKKRPTMKEVVVQLEGLLQLSVKESDVHPNFAEVGSVLNVWHVGSTSAQYNSNPIGTGSPSDEESLLFAKTY